MQNETLDIPETLANNLFFIVGVPRSGTTLLQAMLASHPNILIPPETEYFMYFNNHGNNLALEATNTQLDKYLKSQAWQEQNLSDSDYRDAISKTDRSIRSLFLSLMMLHIDKAGSNKCRIGEKSPHHCRHVLRILDMFPSAKFIHIHRDPRDVVASRIKLKWSQHASCLSVAREWANIMADHFQLVQKLSSKNCYLTVRYETLVDSPETEIQRVCNFLNETYNPAMLEYYNRNDAGFSERETQWKGGTMKPLTTASIGRYKQDLTPRQIAGIQKITADIMPLLDYQPEPVKINPLWLLHDLSDIGKDMFHKLKRSVHKRL